jgi:hypothetical protein
MTLDQLLDNVRHVHGARSAVAQFCTALLAEFRSIEANTPRGKGQPLRVHNKAELDAQFEAALEP